MRKTLSLTISIYLVIALIIKQYITPSVVFAGPTSTNYELQHYTFGAGGVASASSQSFHSTGVLGETDTGKSSANTQLQAGLMYTMQANVPPAPTFTNPANNYDRLRFSITQGSNPLDTTYALAISTDNFVSDIRYVKADRTVGTTLSTNDFQTYTTWGGATGSFVTGLQANTTHYLRVKARRGMYTESGFGPVATAMTSTPSLTFGLSSPTITFNNLHAGNSYTDATKTTTLTTSTNAYNGYTIFAKTTSPLTYQTHTIADYTGTNSNPSLWTGTGFGYTTSDTDLSGGVTNRFVSGGTKYAGFQTSGIGDPIADHTSVIEDTSVSNEQFVISYRVTGTPTTVAGEYRNTILYTIIPIY